MDLTILKPKVTVSSLPVVGTTNTLSRKGDKKKNKIGFNLDLNKVSVWFCINTSDLDE